MNVRLRLLVGLASLFALNSGVAQTTKVWNGSASSDWFNPSNWTPAGVPATNDLVNFTNGTINLSAPVTVSGQFNWAGGTIQGNGLTIASNGILNLVGGGVSMQLQGSFTNAGTVNWQSGQLNLYHGPNCTDSTGPIINLPSGVWDIQCDQALGYSCGIWANTYFQNLGTVQKSAGTNVTGVYVPMLNSGLVNVLSGTFELGNGGAVDGTYQTTNGTVVRFNGGNFTSGNSPFVTGPGTTKLIGGNLLLLSNTIPNLLTLGGTVTLGTNFQGGSITNLPLAGSFLNGSYTVTGLLICPGGWSGDLQVAAGGLMTWSGGTAYGSVTIQTNGTFNLAGGGGTVLLQGSFTNAGTVNWQSGQLNLFYGLNCNNSTGPIVNLPGGLWDIQCDQVVAYNCGVGPTAYFENLGTVRRSASNGTTGFYIPFNNLGLLQVLQGSVVLGNGGALGGTYDAGLDRSVFLTGGNFIVAQEPFIPFPYSVQLTGGNLLLTNDTLSRVRLAGGNITLGPSFQGGMITNLTLEGAVLGGDHTVAGRFFSGNGWSGNLQIAPGGMVDWSGGTAYGSVNIASNGTLNLAGGSGTLQLQGAFTNAGTVNWQSGQLNLFYGLNCNNSTGPIVNLPGGLWDIQCDQAVGYNCGVGATAYFENFGTLQKSGGTNSTGLYIPFLNYGLVDVLSGTFELDNGALLDGAFQTTNGTAVNFKNGAFTVGAAPSFAGSGLAQFIGGTLSLPSNTLPNLSMVGGTVTLGTNFQGGSITNLPLAGSFLQGRYTVSGLLDCPNGWSGDLQLAAGGILNWSGGTAYGSVNLASNSILNLEGGSGALQLQGSFTNAGTVNWQSGQLNLYHGPNCTDSTGPIINLPGGLWDIQCDQALGYNCGIWANTYFQSLGTVRKSGGKTSGGFYIPFINTGTLTLDSGTLLFDNGFTSTGGAIQFGLRSLTDFGRLKISGNIAFDGNLSLQLLGGFVPALNNSFPLISYGSSSGLFTNLDVPPGEIWQTNYGGNTFVVSVANISKLVFPAPPLGAMAGAALPAIAVQIQDFNGNSIPTNGVLVTVSLASGTGTLMGTLTHTTDSTGKAVFNYLSCNLSGVKTLNAESPGGWLTPVTSAPFTITPSSAARLALPKPLAPAQPAGVSFSPPLAVLVVDGFGNPVTTSTASITLSSSSSGTGSLSGVTAANSDGITGTATFTNVVYNLGNPAQAESVSLLLTSPGLGSLTNTLLIGTPLPSIRLSNLNSTVSIDTTSERGMFSWTVEGVEQAYQHWFWLGTGSNVAPTSLDHLGTAWSVALTPTNAATRFVSPTLNVQLSFNLQGGTPGSYISSLAETISIQNVSNSPVLLHFYEYSDFDLAGQALGDTTSMGALGQFTQNGKGMSLTATSASPTPNHWEAELYDSTLLDLQSGAPFTLDNVILPVSSGDKTYAVEWDINLSPGQTSNFNLTKAFAPVPIALAITPQGTNVVVSWPTNSLAGLQLRAGVVSEPAASWQVLTNIPEVVGGEYRVKLPSPVGAQCFRLQR